MNKFYHITFLILLCTVFISCKDLQPNDLPFDQNEWKKSDFRVRGRMSGSLSKQKIIIGKTKNEVIEILGNPEEEGFFQEKNGKETYYMKYAVDLGSIFERWQIRYFIMILFDSQTQKAIQSGLMDS